MNSVGYACRERYPVFFLFVRGARPVRAGAPWRRAGQITDEDMQEQPRAGAEEDVLDLAERAGVSAEAPETDSLLPGAVVEPEPEPDLQHEDVVTQRVRRSLADYSLPPRALDGGVLQLSVFVFVTSFKIDTSSGGEILQIKVDYWFQWEDHRIAVRARWHSVRTTIGSLKTDTTLCT